MLVSWDHLLGKCFSQLFILRDCLCLSLRCESCMQQNAVYPVSSCLLISEFSLLVLRDIKDKWIVSSCYVCFWRWYYVYVILSFCFSCVMISFSFFLWCRYPPVLSFPSKFLRRASLVDINCLNLVLSWDSLVYPFMVIENIAGYNSLEWHLCSLIVCMTTV